MTTHDHIDATAGAVQPECDPDYPVSDWPPTDPDELAALDRHVEQMAREQAICEGFDPFSGEDLDDWYTRVNGERLMETV